MNQPVEPTVVRGKTAANFKGAEGVVAKALIDGQSAGAKNVAFGYIAFAPGSSRPPETMEAEEIIYVLEGRTTIISGGKEFTLHAGDAIYIPPHTEHQHTNPDDTEVLRQLYIFSPPGEEGVREWPEVADGDVL
ncbi:cupin domain-containing protein [Nocardia sp. CA-129566]|uniref:cupin domain-containing protein n=1 Tax=Nocardia sp. CA-129566 TaxID=3239976 RepID=UPI003D95CABC